MIVIAKQGSLIDARDATFSVRQNPHREKRGVVAGFSKSARRRMIKKLARMKFAGVRTVFLTLTFSGSPAPDVAKACVMKMKKRLARRYPQMSAVWKMEYQERGSAHFHLIIYNMPFVSQDKLQSMWTECTGETLSIVDIRLCRTQKMVSSYIAKYVAKIVPPPTAASLENASYPSAYTWTGRMWGVWNEAGLPYDAVFMFMVPYDAGDIGEYLLSRMTSCAARARGARKRSGFWLRDDATEAIEFIHHCGAECISPDHEMALVFVDETPDTITRAIKFFAPFVASVSHV